MAALYLLHRALNRLSPNCGVYPYVFVVQPIPEQPLLPAALSKNRSVECLMPGSPWLGQTALPAPVLDYRFARGDGGVAALRKGQLVGYAWWAEQPYDEEEARCVFEWADAADAVFDFDVYVKPEHRGGLGFGAVWDAFGAALRPQGVRRTYSRISRFNLASLRAHARIGAKQIGRVVFVRGGPLTLAVTGRFPFVRAAFGDGSRLRLRLSLTGLTWRRSLGHR